MPFIHVTWLPKACRTASTRKEVADAIIKAVTAVKSADIAPENLVVRFSESVGGFPLPKGYSEKYARGMTATSPLVTFDPRLSPSSPDLSAPDKGP